MKIEANGSDSPYLRRDFMQRICQPLVTSNEKQRTNHTKRKSPLISDRPLAVDLYTKAAAKRRLGYVWKNN